MEAIKLLHEAWCSAAAQEVNYRATERIFTEAHNMGFVPDDVKIAVKHLIKFNNKSEGAKFRINVFRVMGDLESFASLVAEARAVLRNRIPAPTERDKIIALHEQVVVPQADGKLDAITVREALRKAIG